MKNVNQTPSSRGQWSPCTNNRLFRKYIFPNRNLVYSVCRRYYSGNDEGFLQDLYQEAMANLYRYIHTYDPSRSLPGWIFVVTKRLVGDFLRRRDRMKYDGFSDPERIPASFDSNPEPDYKSLGLENYREHYSDAILIGLELIGPMFSTPIIMQQAG